MPTRDRYSGPIFERLRALAQHHHKKGTRHISKYEYEILLEAADLLEGIAEVGIRPRIKTKGSASDNSPPEGDDSLKSR
jgi:hypothetical protein